jgi:hypothetical protein
VYFDRTIKHHVLGFSCPNPFLEHPHLKKASHDFPLRKFEDRLRFKESNLKRFTRFKVNPTQILT